MSAVFGNDEAGTLLVSKAHRGVDLLREIVEGARLGGFGNGLADDVPVAELAVVLDRVRELEGHVAQLQEQRDEALVQRDDRQACSDLLARLTLAVGYLLDRAQKDAKLGYHLGPHVEAWERLVALEAEVLERDPAAHRSARARAL